MHHIVAYLQGAAGLEEIPNAKTLEALEEVEETGSGQHFKGTAEDFTKLLLPEA